MTTMYIYNIDKFNEILSVHILLKTTTGLLPC